jgi:hypothetical protein
MGKLPASWLDDPEWEMLRRKAEKRHIPRELKRKVAAQKPQAKTRREEPRARANREDTEKEVVVNLKLAIPKVKPPDFKRLYQARKRQIIKVGSLALVVIAVFGIFNLISARKRAEEAKKPVAPEEQAQQSFNPLVPLDGLTDAAGKKIATPEFKYDEEKKVLGYVSDYNGAKLTVSQQALPGQLKIHPGQLEGIARSVNANIPIETQKGKAYLATDDETKTQVAVFATDNVLVFVRSTKTLDNDDWKFYINQLNARQ